MELVEIIRGAQDAMDRGDYRLAVAACQHVLETYPSSLTAHRMLGESVLELGETERAIDHFQRAIAIDPLNVVARLGLGVAAEEKRDMNQAYSAYLHAWEINPALDQVRDELVRLRGLLGGGDRLHPTRAGLAGIYARGGQFGRAAAEWRAVLLAEPESRRAKTSLAEVHWRSGDDGSALIASRDALTHSPDNVRALAMIADIETRRGSQTAPEFVERYQFADPAGEIVAIMQEWRDELDLSVLRRESAILTDFDFSATPIQDRIPVAAAVPAMVSGLATSQFGAPDLWDSLIQDFKPGDPGYAANGAVQPDVEPFAWFEDGAGASNGSADSFSTDSLSDPFAPALATMPSREQDAFEREFAGLGTGQASGTQPFQPFASEPVVPIAAVQPVAPAPVAPVTGPLPTQPPVNAARDQFVNAEGGIDLTVGWDDLDRQLKEATPNFEPSKEMDALMAQLGVDGLQPFEVADNPFDESAWAPFTDDDLVTPARPATDKVVAAQPVAPPVQPEWVAPVHEPIADQDIFVAETTQDGWDIDNDLLAAIPGQKSSGYTELFRHVDTEVVQGGLLGEEIDPFANPDSAGSPLDFEDLLAVTSRDGTAPLRDAHPGANTLAGGESIAADLGWADFQPGDAEPFSIEAFEQAQPNGLYDASAQAIDDSLIEFIPFEPQAVEPPQSAPDPGMSALFDDLGDLQPFSIDDTILPFSVQTGERAVDFSEINDAPFDPATLPKLVVPPVPQPLAALAMDWNVVEDRPAAVAQSPEWEIEQVADRAPVHVEPLVAASPVVAQYGGLGIRPGGVAWPAFVNHTSELIDRGGDGGNLFLRLRENKRAASAAGILRVDRTVVELRPVMNQQASSGRAVIQVMPPAETIVASVPGSQPLRAGWMTEEERLDLMAMRVRLIDDDGSAHEIAELLEVAVSRGLSDPLALRVLGEAYLKLGKTEQAAAQFRHAMLERRRSR